MPINMNGHPVVESIDQWREILNNWNDDNQRQQFCESITVHTPLFDFQNRAWDRPKNMMTAISNRNAGFCYLEDQVVAPHGIIVYQIAPNLYMHFDGQLTYFFKLTGKRIKVCTTVLPDFLCQGNIGTYNTRKLSRFTDLKISSDDFVKILFNAFVIFWTDWRKYVPYYMKASLSEYATNRFGELSLNEYTDMNRRIFDKRQIYGPLSEQVMAEINTARELLNSKEQK